jgi:hypothetical protein
MRILGPLLQRIPLVGQLQHRLLVILVVQQTQLLALHIRCHTPFATRPRIVFSQRCPASKSMMVRGA